MGKFIGLEATIKSKKDFPNEPGNWAYFSFTNKNHVGLKPTAKPFKTHQCASCHVAGTKAGVAQDMVFTKYYPVFGGALEKLKKM